MMANSKAKEDSMSQTTIFKWTCPQCGRTELVMRPVVFDAETNPRGAQDIKEETYFKVRCSACGAAGDFLLNMLYADRSRGFLVALQPDRSLPLPPVPAGTWKALRVVRDAEDLADKVRALESSIDDRLIAVAEYLLYRKIRAALPAGSAMGMAVFHEGEAGPEILLPMEIAGRGYAMGRDALDAKRLEELTEAYGAALAADAEAGFRLVDRAWAADFVESLDK